MEHCIFFRYGKLSNAYVTLTIDEINYATVSFCWTRPGCKPTIYHTRGEQVNHYTTGYKTDVLEFGILG